VRITYRFEEPEETPDEMGREVCEVSRNNYEFLKAKAEAGRWDSGEIYARA
jgi:hypothetical protein